MITHHAELLDKPPTDEEAGLAESRLCKFLKLEAGNPTRTELQELAPYIRYYTAELVLNPGYAAEGLIAVVEEDIRNRHNGQLRRETIECLAQSAASKAIFVCSELLGDDETKINFEQIYPDPASRRRPINIAA